MTFVLARLWRADRAATRPPPRDTRASTHRGGGRVRDQRDAAGVIATRSVHHLTETRQGGTLATDWEMTSPETHICWRSHLVDLQIEGVTATVPRKRSM